MSGTDQPQPTSGPNPDVKGRAKWRRRFWRCLLTLNVSYVLFILLLPVLFRTVGEKHWLVSILLFVPQQSWALPALLLVPACVISKSKAIWIQLGLLTFIFLVLLPWHWNPGSRAKGGLKIMTNNIGQRKMPSLEQFMKAEMPDICLFQEAWRYGRTLSKVTPGRYLASQGQFLINSRYEIKDSGFVPGTFDVRAGWAAAWFEVAYEGRPLVVYNVHLPTPRQSFQLLRGKGLLKELKEGGGIFSGEVRKQFSESMERRIDLATALKKHLQHEKRPYIVVGDFNMPAIGFLHTMVTADMTDTFAAKGAGYGFTFPGDTWNPIAFFEPWLRLDYILAGPGWETLECRVEEAEDAQHRAVVARIMLGEEKRP